MRLIVKSGGTPFHAEQVVRVSATILHIPSIVCRSVDQETWGNSWRYISLLQLAFYYKAIVISFETSVVNRVVGLCISI